MEPLPDTADTGLAPITEPPHPNQALKTKTEAILADLRRLAERKSQLDRWVRPVIVSFATFEVVYGLAVKIFHWPVPAPYARPLEWLINIAIWTVFCATMPEFIFAKRVKKSRAQVGGFLWAVGKDTRAVGSLAQLTRSTMLLSVSDLVLEPLLKMLPNVKASDARYISDSQMEALLALLVVHRQNKKDPLCAELPLAVLKALEQIGDSRAMEPVRRLTTGKQNLPYHQAAQKCLLVLEQQGEERDYHRTLLVPASEEIAQETLLRPTGAQTETQPELLLRATTGEETS